MFIAEHSDRPEPYGKLDFDINIDIAIAQRAEAHNVLTKGRTIAINIKADVLCRNVRCKGGRGAQNKGGGEEQRFDHTRNTCLLSKRITSDPNFPRAPIFPLAKLPARPPCRMPVRSSI